MHCCCCCHLSNEHTMTGLHFNLLTDVASTQARLIEHTKMWQQVRPSPLNFMIFMIFTLSHSVFLSSQASALQLLLSTMI